jgi:hypothetical protein
MRICRSASAGGCTARPGSGWRRAPLVACLALAAELAADWGIVPFQPPGIADWSAIFAADPQRDNRPEMALDLVREYLAAHADKMYGADDGSHPPATGWIGHEAKEGSALLPEKLREELRRRGYELDAVIPGWLEMGVLFTMDTQRPGYLIPAALRGACPATWCSAARSSTLTPLPRSVSETRTYVALPAVSSLSQETA